MFGKMFRTGERGGYDTVDWLACVPFWECILDERDWDVIRPRVWMGTGTETNSRRLREWKDRRIEAKKLNQKKKKEGSWHVL